MCLYDFVEDGLVVFSGIGKPSTVNATSFHVGGMFFSEGDMKHELSFGYLKQSFCFFFGLQLLKNNWHSSFHLSMGMLDLF